jgi:hypothetical protein
VFVDQASEQVEVWLNSVRPVLYVREADRIAKAPVEDITVASNYPDWADKGRVVKGVRLTLMCAKQQYHTREPIHLIHVVEFVEPGHTTYIMGPKPVYGEYVDGKLATASIPGHNDGLAPLDYDGVTVPSPGIDFNYEITTYRLPPGDHEFCWRFGHFNSNTLKIKVVED